MDELLSLKWNNHRSTFLHILTVLRDKQLYTDATLACEGHFYSVHQLVLSTCSDYFSAMFDKTVSYKNPIIVLKDIKACDLEALLDYMYIGEVNVKQADLASLIKSAECLRVKGLAVPDDEPPKKQRESSRKLEGAVSPSPKRRRKDDSYMGKEAVVDESASFPSRLSPSLKDQQSRHKGNEHTNSHVSGTGTIIDNCDIPIVKVEPEDDDDIIEHFSLPGQNCKKELGISDVDSVMGEEAQDFLQAGEKEGDSCYSDLPGTSTYTTGDVSSWQEESELSYPSFSTDGSGQSSGDSGLICQKKQSVVENSYNCNFCGKAFPFASYLTQHLRTHTGERPFPCGMCSYRAKHKGDLKKHQIVHISMDSTE